MGIIFYNAPNLRTITFEGNKTVGNSETDSLFGGLYYNTNEILLKGSPLSQFERLNFIRTGEVNSPISAGALMVTQPMTTAAKSGMTTPIQTATPIVFSHSLQHRTQNPSDIEYSVTLIAGNPASPAISGTIDIDLGSGTILSAVPVEVIGNKAFVNSDGSVMSFSSDGDIEIPSEVKYISSDAFKGTTDITSVEFLGSETLITMECFSGTSVSDTITDGEPAKQGTYTSTLKP